MPPQHLPHQRQAERQFLGAHAPFRRRLPRTPPQPAGAALHGRPSGGPAPPAVDGVHRPIGHRRSLASLRTEPGCQASADGDAPRGAPLTRDARNRKHGPRPGTRPPGWPTSSMTPSGTPVCAWCTALQFLAATAAPAAGSTRPRAESRPSQPPRNAALFKTCGPRHTTTAVFSMPP